MNNYFEIYDLKNIYLEDSFVLGIKEKNNEIEFIVDFVLTENHPLYSIPKENENYCYKKGILLFKGVTSVLWEERKKNFFFDKNNEIDYGNIDCFYFSKNNFRLSGDWGIVNFKADAVAVTLD